VIRPRHILLVGYYGFGNLGDDAILDATLAGLRAGCAPEPVVTIVAGEPVSAAARYGVRAVHWQDIAAIMDAVREADLVVIGGGGLFQDWWGVDPDLLLVPDHWGMALYAGPAIFAAAVGRPVALHALGVGPLTSPQARRLAKAACDAAVSIVVRDEPSRAVLESCGVRPGRIEVAADPVFALDLGAAASATALRERLGGHRGPIVGAALRPWQVGDARWEREVARALDLVVERHAAAVLLVPFQSVHHEWPPGYRSDTDRDVAVRVREAMQHDDRAFIADDPTSPGEVARWFGSCDAVLAMRLHGVVLAALGGTPAAALAYDPKVAACADALGLRDLTSELEAASGDRVAAALGRILDDRDELERRVARRLAPLAAAAADGIATLVRTVTELPPAPGAVTAELAEHLNRLITANVARAAGGDEARSERDLFRDRVASAEAARAEAGVALEASRARARAAEEGVLEAGRRADALEAEVSRLQSTVQELEVRAAAGEDAERELDRWRTSRLWRAASAYWWFRGRVLRMLRGGDGDA